ncbi:hypothetical protein Tco_0998383 [Tanacetum coccineum]
MERITIKEFKVESKVFNLLEIDVDLFTYDTPLGMIFDEFRRLSGMKNDLFTYEVECYDEYERIFAEAVILIEDILVKLIAITLEKWLDLKFRDHKKVYKEIMEGVVANAEFAKWLASNFNNHITMDWYTKNALWLYWKSGNDEDVLTYDELSDLEEENLSEGNELRGVGKEMKRKSKKNESSKDAWINYLPNDDSDVIQANQEWLDNHEPMEGDDDNIIDLDD